MRNIDEKAFQEDIQALIFSLPYQWRKILEKINNLNDNEELVIDSLKTIKVTIDRR